MIDAFLSKFDSVTDLILFLGLVVAIVGQVLYGIATWKQ
jgi:hypothetical protein